MSQDKDDKSKMSGSSASPTGEKSGDAAKRPYATLDLKAVEIPADKSGTKPAAPAAAGASSISGGTKPADPAKSPSTGSTGSSAPAQSAANPGSTYTSGKSSAANSSSATSTPKQPTPASAAKPDSRQSAISPTSWVPTLVSGAAGAVLAMLGLGSMGLIGGDPNAAALEARLALLEQSKTQPPSADLAKQLAAADQRLQVVEASARSMAQAQTALIADAKSLDTRLAGQAPATTAAADRLQKLETQLADLAAAATSDPQRGRIPALAAITTKLGELDTQLTTRSSSLKSELSQEMEQRLAKSAETAETARARLAQRTQSLEQTLKSVADDTTALRSTVDGLKGDIDTRFKSTAKPADVAAAVEPVTTKIAGLEKNLANVVRSEQDRNATAGNILLSIELSNLKRAIDRGGRFAPELAAVKKVGGEKLNLAVLENAQASGVPSLAALTTEFRSLAYTMLDAEADPDQGSVVDRLLASAKSVVRVRKVQHSPDDKGTEAVVGRMEANLREGRLGDVLDVAKTLAPKPAAATGPWLKKIEARYAIETALADLDQSLKNALAGSADVKKGAN